MSALVSSIDRWGLLRYAALATLGKHRVLEMFLRRHELSMALIANGLSRSAAAHAYSKQPEEDIQEWVLRLKASLPALSPQALPEPGDRRVRLLAAATVPDARAAGWHDGRVDYEESLAYPEYVAASGLQVMSDKLLRLHIRKLGTSEPPNALGNQITRNMIAHLLATEAHSVAPLLPDSSRLPVAELRKQTENIVQHITWTRGIDFSVGDEGLADHALLAAHLQLTSKELRRNARKAKQAGNDEAETDDVENDQAFAGMEAEGEPALDGPADETETDVHEGGRADGLGTSTEVRNA